MAEAVVDPLEAIDVEEVDGRGVVAAAAIDRVREPVGEESTIRKASERVVECQALELGLHALAVGHVEEDSEEERVLAGAVPTHDSHFVADPHESAVRAADPVLLNERFS